jgi:hypothetical protein
MLETPATRWTREAPAKGQKLEGNSPSRGLVHASGRQSSASSSKHSVVISGYKRLVGSLQPDGFELDGFKPWLSLQALAVASSLGCRFKPWLSLQAVGLELQPDHPADLRDGLSAEAGSRTAVAFVR